MKRNLKLLLASLGTILLLFLFFEIMFCNIDLIKRKNYSSKMLNTNFSSIYSWHIEDIEEDLDFFDQILDYYNVHRLYQSFDDEYLSGRENSLMKHLDDLEIEVYQLTGDSTWGLEDGHKKILESMDKVINYNNKNKYNIRGLLLDIEPYTNDQIDKFNKRDFEVYLSELEKTINYAHKNNLKIIVAVPYWYDSIDMDCLKKLIQMVDGISVMNYHIDNTIEDIRTEVELSKTFSKIVDSVYMVKYDDEKYFDSEDQILADYANLKAEYNYTKYLYLSLHDYQSIVKYSKEKQ